MGGAAQESAEPVPSSLSKTGTQTPRMLWRTAPEPSPGLSVMDESEISGEMEQIL